MRCLPIVMLLLAGSLAAQMEKRDLDLYRLDEFRKRSPAVGKKIGELELRDAAGKKIKLSDLRKKPLVIIGGAYT